MTSVCIFISSFGWAMDEKTAKVCKGASVILKMFQDSHKHEINLLKTFHIDEQLEKLKGLKTFCNFIFLDVWNGSIN